MERVILHCDLNSFYASVELLSHPELRALPVAVCGDPASRHGIILAKNEPATAQGVKTAEPIWQARKKCPNLVLLPAHRDRYLHFSRQVNSLYNSYTDLVEPFGIDESWLDLTGSLHLFGGDPLQVADRIRHEVRDRFGLTISVGVSFNKIFAKLGSDYQKPDATTVISRDNFRRIVWPLPVTDLLFVGAAAARALARFNIHTIGQLAACDRDQLEKLLGRQGGQLSDYARGLDRSPVLPAHRQPPPKSVGNGLTFPHDLSGEEEIRGGLAPLADTVATRLRRHGLKCAAIQVTVRDPGFHTITRQKSLPQPTNLSRELAEAALELVRSARSLDAPVRMLTITGQHLLSEADAAPQLSLFARDELPRRDRQEALERAMDRIRDRFGPSAIAFGAREGSASADPEDNR